MAGKAGGLSGPLKQGVSQTGHNAGKSTPIKEIGKNPKSWPGNGKPHGTGE